MKKNCKRFKVIPNVGIKDDLTGEILTNDRDICNKMNKVSDRSDEIVEEFFDVIGKYGIHTLKKLDLCLFYQRVW